MSINWRLDCRSKPLLVPSLLTLVLLHCSAKIHADQPTVNQLEAQVESLSLQLEEARNRLAEARKSATASADEAEDSVSVKDDGMRLGPVSIGGAVRVNYVYGDYVVAGDAPQRGGNGGNFELDTFRINAALAYKQWIGKFEYRWYDGYNFLHTAWLGYQFGDESRVEAGVTRVPFGPAAYGVSQSWFYDQHYYVGLADDMDFGVKYLKQYGDWELALAYFLSSEGSWNGASKDSARYSYDAVRWESSIAANGDVIEARTNGYDERNQLNARAIYKLEDVRVPTDIGMSLQWGQLDGKRADDGDHWAVSAHAVSTFGNFKLASQLTRYEIDADNSGLGAHDLFAMGAYDFAWPVATKAWIPALSLSYRIDTPAIPWLHHMLPYIEYSSIVKDNDKFNDSELLVIGSAWASGGWYIYSDVAYSNGNLFVGDKGDDYSNIYDGVGDFGVAGNNEWNYRFNLNLGYYY